MDGVHIIFVCSFQHNVCSIDVIQKVVLMVLRKKNIFFSYRLTHNWWHVAVCYLEAESPLQKVLDVYDKNIMKELEKSDCEAAEVFLLVIFP